MIPRKQWEYIERIYGKTAAFENGIIFATASDAYANDKAKEMAGVKTGIIYRVIDAFASAPPELPACEICRGYANRVSDPKVEDYIVYTSILSVPRSRNLESFETDPDSDADGVLHLIEHVDVTFQVGCYGRYGAARMNRLRNAFNGSKGPEFFANFNDRFGGVGIVRAKSVSDGTTPDATTDYSLRLVGEFTVAVRNVSRFSQGWADRLDITLRGAKGV